jgi:hypothetical protein
MSTALVIRIIGGVCGGAIGTYVTGQIYHYIYNRPQQLPPSPPEPPKKFESKIKDAKSFEEILNIQVQELIDNGNKHTYDYDNEHGNTIKFRKPVNNILEEEETRFVNDSLYDNNFDDYFTLLSSLYR